MTPLFASEYRGADRNLAIAIWEDIQPCSDLQLYRNKKFQPHTHRDRLLPLASQLFSPCSIQADRLVCYHIFSFFLPRNFFFQADMRFYISMRDCWIRPQETCLRNLKHYSTSEPPRIILYKKLSTLGQKQSESRHENRACHVQSRCMQRYMHGWEFAHSLRSLKTNERP